MRLSDYPDRLLGLMLVGSLALTACESVGAEGSEPEADISGPADTSGVESDAADADVPSDSDAGATDVTADSDGGEATLMECEKAGDGASCDDGNACTAGDTCASGICVGATNVVCDADVCEVATCDPMTGCVITYEPNGSECEVGCFGTATCQEGNCEVDPASAVQCPASDDTCVAQLGCDSATGLCTVVIPMPAGVDCDLDENVCSLDACDGEGACVSTGGLNGCETQNNQSPCWTWGCNDKAGCVQVSFVEGVSCNDNNPCTYSDICGFNEFSQGLCQGEPLPIDDENPCTDDTCMDGTVTHTPIDGLSCSVPGCEVPGVCASGACEPPLACLCTAVDGGWSEITWGECSTSCGAGTRAGTRTCTAPAPSCDGAPCEGEDLLEEACEGETICGEFEACEEGQCVATCEPVDGAWSSWSEGACSASCGEGVSVHTRACDSPAPSCGGAACPGESVDTVACDGATQCGQYESCVGGQCEASCLPVDGAWSDWSWEACPVECGASEQMASRTCDSPTPSCGGVSCQGEDLMSAPCNGLGCGEFEACVGGQCEASCSPLDGGWSDWNWEACPVECGASEQMASRTCDSPAPSCGGVSCQGEDFMSAPCNGLGCGEFETCEGGKCQASCAPVSGGWTDWTWGACSAECGGGSRTGTRSCSAPLPSCGGASCSGATQMVESCNLQACVNYLPEGVTSYTSGGQVITGEVPAGVTSISVHAWGAGGGGGFPGLGGGGAHVAGTVSVSPGDSVELRVGDPGVANGGGGGASYLFVNEQAVLIAAGGGGAGSDGCSGCNQAIGSAANGGGGGGVNATGQAGSSNDKYSTNSGGGGGASASGPGVGGVSNNQSNYSGCEGNGASGGSHSGGGGHAANQCKPGNNGASYQNGGAQGYGNGGGGGGGGGLYGGGGGAGKYTYTGGGGGGGASWTDISVYGMSSDGGWNQLPGGTGALYYQGSYGRGGDAGDHTNWPNDYSGPSAGHAGMVVLVL